IVSIGFEQIPCNFPCFQRIPLWRQVRCRLPPPPGSPGFAEISRRSAKGPELAGFRAVARSLQLANRILGVGFGAFVSSLEISFPGNGDRQPKRLGSTRRPHESANDSLLCISNDSRSPAPVVGSRTCR